MSTVFVVIGILALVWLVCDRQIEVMKWRDLFRLRDKQYEEMASMQNLLREDVLAAAVNHAEENKRLRDTLELLIEEPREGSELTPQQRQRNCIIRVVLGETVEDSL